MSDHVVPENFTGRRGRSVFMNHMLIGDVIIIPHHAASLDYDRLHIYPQHTHGGNGRHQYADVEVVRVGCAKAYGPYRILKEVWIRYQIPTAVTEVHLHCTREEQLRWFGRVLQDAKRLQKEGVDIRAVTAWALLGSFGWNCLLRQACGDYEAGVFDVSSGTPRATALSSLIAQAAKGSKLRHPLLRQRGWWERDIRILYHKTVPLHPSQRQHEGPVLLIIARAGIMGSTFSRLCELRNIPYKIISREELHLTGRSKPEDIVPGRKIWAIVDAVEYFSSSQAERAERDRNLNSVRKSGLLASFAKRWNIKMLTFSEDPLTEHHVMLQNPEILMVRTSLFSSGEHEPGHNSTSLKRVRRISFTSTDIRELVNSALDLLQDNESGVWHLVDPKQHYQPALTATNENIRIQHL